MLDNSPLIWQNTVFIVTLLETYQPSEISYGDFYQIILCNKIDQSIH